MNQLFELTPIDFTQEPLFLGSGRNISRLDLSIQSNISAMTANALGLMWFADDFPYSKDAKDYQTMSPILRDLFLKNLKFQTTLDSLAARTVAEVFIPVTTNPQCESWWYSHAFFENNIHSLTYAEILKAMPTNAIEIFDDIMINDNIINRAKSILAVFEETVVHNSMRSCNHPSYDLFEHQKSIIMSLYALNILEAVLFKSSFLTSFGFKENGMMSVTADAIARINIDEIGHYGMTVNLLNHHRNNPQWAPAVAAVEQRAVNLYKSTLQADYDWIDYLWEDGAQLLGLNSQVMKQYADHNIRSVMLSVGLEPITHDTFNPCLWASKYSKPSNIQTAQKEKTSANYKLGITDTNMTQSDWDEIAKDLT